MAEGLWTVAYEHRERVTVPVLHAAEGAPTVDDIQDRTAELVNGRAERRKRAREQREAGDRLMVAANLEGAIAAGGARRRRTRCRGGRGRIPRSDRTGATSTCRVAVWIPSWASISKPTGTDPLRDYIIDVGFEYMNMVTPRPQDAPAGMPYVDSSYQAGDAYGQARLGFGVTRANAWHGSETIRNLTGIDVKMRSSSQWRLFDEWPQAQQGLLMRLEQQPFRGAQRELRAPLLPAQRGRVRGELPRRAYRDHRHDADEPPVGRGVRPQRSPSVRRQLVGILRQAPGRAARGFLRAASGPGGRRISCWWP